ncbi:MAG: peptidoglycan editing factor PgeF, partial [Alphaproteobacteria bacterium]
MNPITINFAPHITAVFFDRTGGVSQGVYAALNGGYHVGDNPEHVAQNIHRMADYLNIDNEHFCFLQQVHSNIVIEADVHQPYPEADGQITSTANIALAIQTADCVPLLLADAKNNIIGVAHAGWGGAYNGVIQNTVNAMVQKGADINHIQAAIGPCIHQPSYEVDAKYRQKFLEQSPNNAQFFVDSDKADHYRFNLPKYAERCLADVGVTQIQPSKWDTCANPKRFFSHRYATLNHQPATGRLVAAIMLK